MWGHLQVDTVNLSRNKWEIDSFRTINSVVFLSIISVLGTKAPLGWIIIFMYLKYKIAIGFPVAQRGKH